MLSNTLQTRLAGKRSLGEEVSVSLPKRARASPKTPGKKPRVAPAAAKPDILDPIDEDDPVPVTPSQRRKHGLRPLNTPSRPQTSAHGPNVMDSPVGIRPSPDGSDGAAPPDRCFACACRLLRHPDDEACTNCSYPDSGAYGAPCSTCKGGGLKKKCLTVSSLSPRRTRCGIDSS